MSSGTTAVVVEDALATSDGPLGFPEKCALAMGLGGSAKDWVGDLWEWEDGNRRDVGGMRIHGDITFAIIVICDSCERLQS